MFKKYSKRVLAMCLALSLAGCGKGESYTVADYEVNANEEVSASTEISSEAGTSTDSASGADEITELQSEGCLSKKLGDLSHDWAASFSTAGIDVNLNAHSEIMDTDELPVYRVSELKESDINEEEIVKNIFGDSAKKIEGDLDKNTGDSALVVEQIQHLYFGIHPEEVQGLSFEEQMAKNTAPGWVDEENYHIHTYEGTYQNTEYQLFLGYEKSYNSAYIALFPKYLGNYFNNQEIDTAVSFWVGNDLAEQGPIKEFLSQNKLQDSDVDDRIDEAESLLREKFNMKIPDGYLADTMSDSGYDKMYTFYINQKALNGAGYKNMFEVENIYDLMDAFDKMGENTYMLDGFQSLPSYSLGGQEIFVDPRGGSNGGVYNGGEVYLTDEGVMGLWMVYNFQYEEKMSENVPILDYESVTKAFEDDLTETLTAVDFKNSTLNFEDVRMVYYPAKSPDVEGEMTLVPAWEFMNGTCDTFVMINAVDGSLLDIIH
ncbi:MAG: hypothetical protein J6O17_09430 [Eubacterium sp.]|nr:hypothetical protein [Eubacterium sp.]